MNRIDYDQFECAIDKIIDLAEEGGENPLSLQQILEKCIVSFRGQLDNISVDLGFVNDQVTNISLSNFKGDIYFVDSFIVSLFVQSISSNCLSKKSTFITSSFILGNGSSLQGEDCRFSGCYFRLSGDVLINHHSSVFHKSVVSSRSSNKSSIYSSGQFTNVEENNEHSRYLHKPLFEESFNGMLFIDNNTFDETVLSIIFIDHCVSRGCVSIVFMTDRSARHALNQNNIVNPFKSFMKVTSSIWKRRKYNCTSHMARIIYSSNSSNKGTALQDIEGELVDVNFKVKIVAIKYNGLIEGRYCLKNPDLKFLEGRIGERVIFVDGFISLEGEGSKQSLLRA